MSRLIDADELKLDLKWLECDTPVYHDVMSTIDERTAVDPVKHGHWKRTDILFCRQNAVRCSCCGHLTPTYGKVLDSFCRFCGAKMDEVLNVPLRNGKSTMELERLMDEVKEDG